MKEPKIVFAAIVAYTEQVTNDGRILSTPEGFTCPVRELPVPVLWIPPNHKGKSVPTVSVGRITDAYVVDHRLISFGEMFETERGREATSLLRDHDWRLEIDVDSGDMTYDLDPLLPELEQFPVGPVIFKSWRLRAAWVGTQPCWKLPKIQIEEIRV